MLTAYILVETTIGMNVKVHEQLKAFREVRSSDRINGPHDIIAKVEVVDMEALGGFLEDRVRLLPGVVKTSTCVVLPG